MMQWLRRSFIAGFFVTVPLFISVAAVIWIFKRRRRPDDAAVRPAARAADSRLGILSTTAAAFVLVGATPTM